MTKGHVFFIAIALILAAATFKLLPRYEFYPTANGVLYTYDKWNNNVLVCYANGCRKAENDLKGKSNLK